MFTDRGLSKAILISFITHGLLLSQALPLTIAPRPRRVDRVEVHYLKSAQLRPRQSALAPMQLPAQIIATSKRAPSAPPAFFEKQQGPLQGIQRQESIPSEKPAFVKPDNIAIKKRISLPAVGVEKINNPTYLNYYQLIREKIRRQAYRNYIHSETGEIYLSFIISKDGFIRAVRLVEDKSVSSDYLRAISLSSVKDASPFPNFPKDLDYPQLSFNVIISYEIE